MLSVGLSLHGQFTSLQLDTHPSMFILRVPPSGIEIDTRRMSSIWLGELRDEIFMVKSIYTKTYKYGISRCLRELREDQ